MVIIEGFPWNTSWKVIQSWILTYRVLEINPPVLNEKMHESNKQNVQIKKDTAINSKNNAREKISKPFE